MKSECQKPKNISDETLELGEQVLSGIIKNSKNVSIFNKHISSVSIFQCADTEDIDETYKRNLYQVVGDILQGCPLTKVLSNIKKSSLGWKHPMYDNISQKIKEHDEFLVTPFEVVDGVSKCPKKNCGNEKVFTYTKQCRGSDETSSVFYQCMKCNYKWVYSG